MNTWNTSDLKVSQHPEVNTWIRWAVIWFLIAYWIELKGQKTKAIENASPWNVYCIVTFSPQNFPIFFTSFVFNYFGIYWKNWRTWKFSGIFLNNPIEEQLAITLTFWWWWMIVHSMVLFRTDRHIDNSIDDYFNL